MANLQKLSDNQVLQLTGQVMIQLQLLLTDLPKGPVRDSVMAAYDSICEANAFLFGSLS